MRAHVAAVALLIGVFAPLVSGQTYEVRGVPLVIDSRDDWIALGVEGDGTAADPFVLEGYRFEISPRVKDPVLVVRNVPDHLVLRHVLIDGGTVAILVEDAPNVRVENVTIRNSQLGIKSDDIRLDHVTIADTSVGLRGAGIVVRNASFIGNGVAIEGPFVDVLDSRFEGNPRALVYVPQPALPAGAKAPVVERSIFRGSASSAISTDNALVVRNSTFADNGVGIYYTGKTPAMLIEGNDFGKHDTGAVVVDTDSPGWDLPAPRNWWGGDLQGKATAPSPDGYGSPISGPVDYDPLASRPSAVPPLGAPGAQFPNATGPTFTDAGSYLETSEGRLVANVRGQAHDPDGLSYWTVTAANTTMRSAVEGSTARVSFYAIVPPGTTDVPYVLRVADAFGTESVIEGNITAPPPPPPKPQPNATADMSEQQSPASWIAVPTAFALVALALRRRLTG